MFFKRHTEKRTDECQKGKLCFAMLEEKTVKITSYQSQIYFFSLGLFQFLWIPYNKIKHLLKTWN